MFFKVKEHSAELDVLDSVGDGEAYKIFRKRAAGSESDLPRGTELPPSTILSQSISLPTILSQGELILKHRILTGFLFIPAYAEIG